MSAWPEAVWIVRETQKAFNIEQRLQALDDRLKAVEHRYLIVATGDNGPNYDSSISEFSAGSLWFKIIAGQEGSYGK